MAAAHDSELIVKWWGTAKGVQGWHHIRRSRLFVALPAAITFLLGVILLWAIVRQNIGANHRAEWPFKLIILDVAPAASLLGVFGALIFARAQLARTMSPHFGYSWTDVKDENGEQRWELHFYNGGPGHARLTSIVYLIDFYETDDSRSEATWLMVGDLYQVLKGRRVNFEDFDVAWIGGAPLTPQSTARDGFRLVSANVKGLAAISRFEVRMEAIDPVGDLHRLHIRATARIPLRAVQDIEEHRARPQGRTVAPGDGDRVPPPAVGRAVSAGRTGLCWRRRGG